MITKRFTYFQNRIGAWIIEDNIKDKYLIDIPAFIGFDNEIGAKLFCDLLNEFYQENLELKGEVAYYRLMLMSLEQSAKRICENSFKSMEGKNDKNS